MSLFTSLFCGQNPMFYREHEGGPFVVRNNRGVAPGEAAAALRDMKAAYAELMAQEGVDDPHDLLPVKTVTPLHLKASAAADRVQKLFVECDAYVADDLARSESIA